jgi:hypothetical protein
MGKYAVAGSVAAASGALCETGGPTKVLATGQASPWGIAVDGRAVYWTNSGDGTIMMRAKM